MKKNLIILIAINTLIIHTVTFAQDVPPPLNPWDSPWGAPSDDKKNDTNNGNSDSGSASPFGLDNDDDSSDGGFFGGSSGSSKREGKSSFMLLEPSSVSECDAWSNHIIMDKSFSDFNECQFQLEKKMENLRTAIEQSIDQIERFKLKKYLRGKMKNEARKKNQLRYPTILARMKQESKQGCLCLSKK